MLHTLAGVVAMLAALVARWLLADDDRRPGPGYRLWDWDGEPTPPVPRGSVMVTRHDDDDDAPCLAVEVGGGRLYAVPLTPRRGLDTYYASPPN